MAFGFGFNKQKALNSAEKFVQQGKLQNAISEYEKVLKSDPKDLTVMNTVGDLYARLGQTDQAVDRFKSVGDAYASQGFTVKAIAMYKKLSKLKPSLDSVLRLAELYTQQGLFNDARAQYLQVAEEFLRTGELEQAVRIFQKTLEMDPENINMRTRLAEVYTRLGKKNEAWQIFSTTAESLRARGATVAAEEVLQRMTALDPNNAQTHLLRGRLSFDSGDVNTSIQALEQVADLDSHADGLRTLLKAYLQTGRFGDAGVIAGKLINVHNDTEAVTTYADALMGASRYDQVLQVYDQYSPRLLAQNPAKVVETVHAVIKHVSGSVASLETVLGLLQKAGESTHLTEVYELLAHACVQSGELEKAREYYHRLTELEPHNQLHANNYQQVVSRMGDGSGPLITVEEGAVLVDELEATAPFLDQRYDSDDVALAVRAALTDAELFASYNMPSKALGPLLAALPKAPHDLRLNQRLAALHTRAGRFAEAAGCCRNLEIIYHDAGHPEEARRYGDLAGKYEDRAAAGLLAASELRAPEASGEQGPSFPIEESAKAAAAAAGNGSSYAAGAVAEEPPAVEAPVARAPGLFWHAPPAPVASSATVEPSAAEESQAGEIDLSDEWEGEIGDDAGAIELTEKDSSQLTGASRDAAIAELIEEIRFYAAHSMMEQARAALAKLEQLGPEAATLSAVEDEVAAAVDRSQAAPAKKPAPAAKPAGRVIPIPEPPKAPAARAPAAFVPPAAEPAAAAPVATLGDFVADLESSLGDSFLAEAGKPKEKPAAASKPAPAASIPAPPRPQAPAAPAPPNMAASSAAAAAPAREAVANSSSLTFQPRSLAPAEAAPAASAGVDLAGMFGELRQELEEEPAAAGEDPETHYNLGVAFREMGLLDEAIGELQKVCQAVDRGHTFPHLMQAYTWLAQCFLDKGVPEAAIRWYERALQIPGLDADTRIALHYEIACSYEAAQNKPAALKHFLEVYGGNIDYRDVAERIKAVKS